MTFLRVVIPLQVLVLRVIFSEPVPTLRDHALVAPAVLRRRMGSARDDLARPPSEPSEIHGCGLTAVLEQRPHRRFRIRPGPSGRIALLPVHFAPVRHRNTTSSPFLAEC